MPMLTPAMRRLPAWMLPLTLGALAIIVVFLLMGRPGAHSSSNIPVVSGGVGSGELRPGSTAPDFSATGFDGQQVHLASLRGKVVLVNFFASWCAECRAEFPDIQQTWEAKRAAGFEVIGVDAFDTGDGRAFYNELHATFPAVSDPVSGKAGPIARAFGLTGSLPVSFFIDRAGKIHDIFPGRIDRSIILGQLAAMGIESRA